MYVHVLTPMAISDGWNVYKTMPASVIVLKIISTATPTTATCTAALINFVLDDMVSPRFSFDLELIADAKTRKREMKYSNICYVES
jgi:hypothetical protein